jgi:hypothetical protein
MLTAEPSPKAIRTARPGLPRPKRRINVVVRDICSTLDFAYNVRRAWGVRYGWRGFTDRAAQIPTRAAQARAAVARIAPNMLDAEPPPS